jgi:uracil phosphoribosyltransferase
MSLTIIMPKKFERPLDMKDALVSILRNRQTTQSQFRKAADKLARLMAADSTDLVSHETIEIETPLGPTKGYHSTQKVLIVPILRSGIALLPAFLDVYDDAQVGFIGIKRDEKTAKPYQYYESIPSISFEDAVFILDPMIATGGSAMTAIQQLLSKGAVPSHICLIGIIASMEGLQAIHSAYPEVQIKVVTVDSELNPQKFIVPGLGDFGDRYFGIA